MGILTRRGFLRAGAAGAVCASGLAGARPAWGAGLGVPLGLQLYSVREMLPKDYEGTLKQIAGLGYVEVEGAAWFGYSAAEVRRRCSAGLLCVSAHHPMDELHKG